VGAHFGEIAVRRLLVAEHGLLVLLIGHGSKRSSVAELDAILAIVLIDILDIGFEGLGHGTVARALHFLELGPGRLVISGGERLFGQVEIDAEHRLRVLVVGPQMDV